MADITDNDLIIRDGLRIGHAADLRKSALYRRFGAALDVLFIFESRLAKMNVHVDEAGKYVQPRRVYDFFALFGRELVRDLFDLSAENADILFFHRIFENYASVFDNHFL